MKKIWKKFLPVVLAVLTLALAGAVSVNAKTVYKNKWVTTSGGKTYYYNANGKKLKGLKKIGKKYYYFDSKRVQRTGWTKIGKNYYFFKTGTKSKGYRVSSTTVNGIKLGKNGKAKMNSYSRRKLPLLVKANQVVQSITNDKMSKMEKLRKAFDYTKSHLRAYNMGSFRSSGDWDMTYAEIVFNTGRADCYGYGAYFAYLANAVGYTATAESSGGHGWTKINGCYFDTNLSLYNFADSYFNMSASLCGRGGRPNYLRYGIYKKTI